MKRCSAGVVDGGRQAVPLSLPLPLSTYFFEITLHADPALPLDAFTSPLSSPYRSRPIVLLFVEHRELMKASLQIFNMSITIMLHSVYTSHSPPRDFGRWNRGEK